MDANFSFQVLATSFHVPHRAAVVLMLTIALAVGAVPGAQAQIFQVIHNFANGADGGFPYAGLTLDAAGNFYGTTPSGGILTGYCAPHGCGGVYRLRAHGSGFVFTPLYNFMGYDDGAYAQGRVIVGPDGNLYGTTFTGGDQGSCSYPDSGCGTVFQLRPSPTVAGATFAPWQKTILYNFTGGNDGGQPQGDIVSDPSGNIYGVTYQGGTNNNGVVYELTPTGGGWTETVLYSAQNNGDGANPIFLTRDPAGNLYGVFFNGGPHGYGAVFQLTHSASGWSEQTLYGFTGQDDGKYPVSLIIDASGNLYGMTYSGGSERGGTVFKLRRTGGGYLFSTVYGLGHEGEGCNPQNAPTLDATGSLYGTLSNCGEYNWGAVFKLTLGDGPSYTSLHDFTFAGLDGYYPASSVVFDTSGNLYGTAPYGGSSDSGVVFEITP